MFGGNAGAGVPVGAMVLLAFVGPCPDGCAIKHSNGDALDNRLENLRYLNVYATKVSDAGLEHIKGLKNLKRLLVWQSQVTPDGMAKLKESLPECTIIAGLELKPAEPPKEEPKPEEKKEEEKKPEEKKPEEKKPDEKKPDEKKPEDKKPGDKKGN